MAFLTPLGLGTGTRQCGAWATSPRRSRRLPRRTYHRSTTMTTLGEKYGHLRNADVPSVSDTMNKFVDAFGRPVPVVYRAVVNELITTTHLAIHCALWRYDVLFAAGFEHVFEAFLSYYPSAEERTKLRQCICDALGLDSAKLAADAASVAAWTSDCADSDAVFAKATAEAASGGDNVAAALRAPLRAKDFEFYYSRCYGIGLITMMQAVGAEVGADSAEKWSAALELTPAKLAAETAVYNSAMERLKQAEQIFAEAAAREAKKTADRLARRAEAAQKKVEMLEAEEKAQADSAASEPAPVTVAQDDK